MLPFISNAYAQEAAQAVAEPNPLMSLMPLILIFGVMYFLMIRPQQKKMKAHQEMINAVRVNDVVVTGGGIIGKITHVNDEKAIVTVEVAANVEVKVNRATITEVLDKDAAKSVLKDAPAPAKKEKAAAKKASAKKKTASK